MRIGILSDTHGLLRQEAVEALRSCATILHGGDIGRPDLLPELAKLAPVHAVRGNIDQGEWATSLPMSITLELGGRKIHMLHKLKDLALAPADNGIDLVIYGHSHKPALEEKEGVTYLNPGAAGKRRFSLPISLALVDIDEGEMQIEFINLLGDAPLP